MKEKKKKKWTILIAALIAIVATAVYSGQSYYRFHQGIPEERPDFGSPGGPPGDGERGDRGRGGWRGGPPTEEERERRMQEMAKELNLTPDQQTQIRNIMSQPWEGGPENRGQRFEQVRSVLTPQQQEQARDMFQSRMRSRMDERMQRRLNEARKSLPEKEVKALEAQMNERRRQMEQRRREGGGPPGFGPPGRRGGPGGPPPEGRR